MMERLKIRLIEDLKSQLQVMGFLGLGLGLGALVFSLFGKATVGGMLGLCLGYLAMWVHFALTDDTLRKTTVERSSVPDVTIK